MLSSTYLLKVISFDYGSLFISLISVIVGVILDKVWTSHTEKSKREEEEKKREEEEKKREEEEKKREEELNNMKLLIKAEYELNLNNLKKFNEKYLKYTLSSMPSSKNRNEIYLEFYKNLQSFPNITHKTWDNSVNIANELFSNYQIKQIMEFNVKSEMIKETSINLHKKSEDKEFVENILKDEYNDATSESHRDIYRFEWEISSLISDGEIILKYFKDVDSI